MEESEPSKRPWSRRGVSCSLADRSHLYFRVPRGALHIPEAAPKHVLTQESLGADLPSTLSPRDGIPRVVSVILASSSRVHVAAPAAYAYALVTGTPNKIYRFRMDSLTGTLTPLDGDPSAAGRGRSEIPRPTASGGARRQCLGIHKYLGIRLTHIDIN